MKAAAGRKIICLFLAYVLMLLSIEACNSYEGDAAALNQEESSEPDPSMFLVAIEDEPDTVDFQCTTIHYTVGINVFSRLVELENNAEGHVAIMPSLAESWEVSDDRRVYTFHLRDGVKFSNNEPLTSSDVLYTFTRLLTNPESVNRDIVIMIEGAGELERGEADSLAGFTIIDDLNFTITLEKPFEAFLSCLSMPGASIMDEKTTEEAGERFGHDPEWTVGTGPFIFSSWEPGKGMILTANPDCFQGVTQCEGVDLRFMTEPEEIRRMFEEGKLDVLNLDDVGNAAEFFIHGDIYQNKIRKYPRIALSYIALNENKEPLNNVRVRKALQYALDRSILLEAVYSGHGKVENGIYPHGLYGYNPDLPEIPYDPDAAKDLLAEAGYRDGFNMEISVSSASTESEITLLRLAQSMWEKIGVHAEIRIMDDEEFIRLRRAGKLDCYTATWVADYDDPDNFIYTFFGNSENSAFRSLNYNNTEIMERVENARTIIDPDARLQEYRELEEIIVQDDAAWIPLFSREYIYVISDRVLGFKAAWNGSVKNRYCDISIRDIEK